MRSGRTLWPRVGNGCVSAAQPHRRAFNHPGSEHARSELRTVAFTTLFLAGTAWFAGLLYVILD